jgi:hypothetical protein
MIIPCRSNLGVLRRNLRHFAHRDVFIAELEKAGVPE